MATKRTKKLIRTVRGVTSTLTGIGAGLRKLPSFRKKAAERLKKRRAQTIPILRFPEGKSAKELVKSRLIKSRRRLRERK